MADFIGEFQGAAHEAHVLRLIAEAVGPALRTGEKIVVTVRLRSDFERPSSKCNGCKLLEPTVVFPYPTADEKAG